MVILDSTPNFYWIAVLLLQAKSQIKWNWFGVGLAIDIGSEWRHCVVVCYWKYSTTRLFYPKSNTDNIVLQNKDYRPYDTQVSSIISTMYKKYVGNETEVGRCKACDRYWQLAAASRVLSEIETVALASGQRHSGDSGQWQSLMPSEITANL